MVNELIFHQEDKVADLLIGAYKELVDYIYSLPDVDALKNHYGTLADRELIQYMAAEYGEDFYDGSIERSGNYLPDSLRNGSYEQLKVPLELSEEQVMEILNFHLMVYKRDDDFYNSPLQEVW